MRRQLSQGVVVKADLQKFRSSRTLDRLNLGLGTVRQAEILPCRESHRGEIRLPAWRRQFAGRQAGDVIELGRDIASISGATLSCRPGTDGVRRIVQPVQLLRGEGGLR